MQTHQIQPKTKQQKAKRVGRGGKKGTYSGRGMKGQGSRSGARFQPRIRELFKRYPKLRGYRRSGGEKPVSFDVRVLEKHFEQGETVNPESLIAKKLLGAVRKKTPAVKILGTGELTKKLAVEKCQVSAIAKEKIEKAGGSVVS